MEVGSWQGLPLSGGEHRRVGLHTSLWPWSREKLNIGFAFETYQPPLRQTTVFRSNGGMVAWNSCLCAADSTFGLVRSEN